MVRLLTVFHYPVYGGPQNQAARLNASLLAAGVETTAVVPLEGLEVAERLSASGVRVAMLPLHRLRAMRRVRSHAELLAAFGREIAGLRRLIRELDADVVQLNGLVNPHAALAARLEGRAVVWQLQDTRAPRWLRAACMPLVLSLSDVVMTTGVAVGRGHPGVGALGQRAVVYYPPVDTDLFRPRPDERERARAILGAPAGDTVVVGALGNVNAQKGHEFALRAVAACGCRNVCLRILGARSEAQREYEERLVAEAMDLGMGDGGRFAIVEPGAGLSQLLSGVDVGLLAAVPLSEGVPTMVLEAMAAGTPVVATDVGGVTEAVDSGVNGIVVRPLDVNAIAGALSRLAMDAELRASLARRARQTAVDRFALRQCTQVHLGAYRLAVERRDLRVRSRP